MASPWSSKPWNGGQRRTGCHAGSALGWPYWPYWQHVLRQREAGIIIGQDACRSECTSESESVLRWRLKKDWLPSKLWRRLLVFVRLPLCMR